ncbi:MAG: hypothetical protein ACHQJ4_04680 [Ignavibacteria bacterium]
MEPKHKSNGVQNKFPFPGIPVISDGSEAIARVESQIAEGGFTHPITPSGNMWKSFINESKKNPAKNIFIQETSSPADAASACEGFALAGGRAVSFTSGDELAAMKEKMFSIAGKRLPVIIHVGSRALTSHSMTDMCSHDDVMSVSDCGWGMLFAKNVQEAVDFAVIARRAAEESYTPFLNIQDGFLTTHKEEKFKCPETDLIRAFNGNTKDKLVNLFNPQSPVMTGAHQGSESFMKGKIAQRDYYEKLPSVLKAAMDEFHKLTGRRYDFIEKYLPDAAEHVIIGLGSGIEEVKRYCENLDNNTGVISISVFRPFPVSELIDALKNIKAITVIERTDNPLDFCNPLTKDIKCAIADAVMDKQITVFPEIYSCTYGLGGGKLSENEITSIIGNMKTGGKRNYSIGVEHSYSIDVPEIEPVAEFSYRDELISEKENG